MDKVTKQDSIAFTYALFLLLFFTNLSSFSQDKAKADSLIDTLNKNKLSKKERVISLASVASFHPDPATALAFANASLQMAIEIEDEILQAEAWEEISHVERRLGNNNLSLEASLNALQIYESKGLKERQAASYTQLASNAISDEDFQSAVTFLKKALALYDRSKEKMRVSIIHNLGEAYRLAGQLDNAIKHFTETLLLNQSVKDRVIEGYTLGNLGMVYATQYKLEPAKKHLNEALNILTSLEDIYAISIYKAELGMVYQQERNLALAETHFLEALDMAQKAGLKEQIRDFSAKLMEFYKTRGNYKKALEYQQLYQVYHDSLVDKEKIQEHERLKAGYVIDKRETEIGALTTINSKQKQVVSLLVLGILSTFFFSYLLFRANRKVKKSNVLLSDQKTIISKREQEKVLLLKELNHRVKNNLQMISSLLNIQSNALTGHPAQESIEVGKHRVEALALVHRKLYQDGADMRIQLKTYIEELVSGLFHGYKASFTPDIDVDDINVHVDKAIPLALILNELVTNALKYAYKKQPHPSLKICMKRTGKSDLDMEIRDNGIGFTEASVKKKGFGITLIQSLVAQLEGTIEHIREQGTYWKMTIKIS